MEVRSVYKYARISPKKARDVAREIQGLPVSEAIDALNFTPKKAAFLIGKTLKSAVANAENNHDLAADSLHIKEANICDGPSFRRFKPRARGSASAIKKRTSHIYIILTDDGSEEKDEPKRQKRSPQKAVAEVVPEEEQSTKVDGTADSVEDDKVSTESAPLAIDQAEEGSADSAPANLEDSPDEEVGVEDGADETSNPGEDSQEEEQKD